MLTSEHVSTSPTYMRTPASLQSHLNAAGARHAADDRSAADSVASQRGRFETGAGESGHEPRPPDLRRSSGQPARSAGLSSAIGIVAKE